jgi:hypothetical protein
MVQRSPRLSTRRMASRIGVSCKQVWRNLHEEALYPFHDHRVQHLVTGDPVQGMDLCQWITAHPQLLIVILFTDEAVVFRVRWQDVRYAGVERAAGYRDADSGSRGHLRIGIHESNFNSCI